MLAAAHVLSTRRGWSVRGSAPVPIVAPADSSWAPGSTRGRGWRPDQPSKQQRCLWSAGIRTLARLCCWDPSCGPVRTSTRATVHIHMYSRYSHLAPSSLDRFVHFVGILFLLWMLPLEVAAVNQPICTFWFWHGCLCLSFPMAGSASYWILVH